MNNEQAEPDGKIPAGKVNDMKIIKAVKNGTYKVVETTTGKTVYVGTFEDCQKCANN